MLNNLSIRTRIIMAQIVLIAMVSVFIYSYYPDQQKKAAIRAITSKIKSIGNMFSIGVGIGMGETDFVAVSEALNWAHTDSAVVYISVVNTNDQKIASFQSEDLSQVPVEAAGFFVPGMTQEIDEVVYYKVPIIYQNLTFGTLTVGYSLKPLEKSINNLRLTTSYFCLALFTAGVVLSIIIGNMITGNIRELDSTVRAISSGRENIRVAVKSNDEIGKLGRAFNHMLYRLDRSRNELVKYSEQLKKQNEELSQFSYVVSHDLKAPLRAIFKLSEWIEEDLGSEVSEESRNNMMLLRSRVFRLEALINGLLQYAKIGRTSVPLEKVSVKTLLDETIDLVNPPPRFRVDIQEGMPVFNTRKILLQQVFINLVSNSIKYNDKPEGIINVRVGSNDEAFYRFVVEDNGIGIDPAYHDKVFGIFQTLEARDKVEGTGIGLSIAKKCVEDVGGTIKLESEAGQGTRVSFTWPKDEIAK